MKTPVWAEASQALIYSEVEAQPGAAGLAPQSCPLHQGERNVNQTSHRLRCESSCQMHALLPPSLFTEKDAVGFLQHSVTNDQGTVRCTS